MQSGDRPLGLCVFSGDRALVDEISRHTPAGGVTIHVAAAQASLPSVGIGGIGPGGMGRRNGQEGFVEFSDPRGHFERRPGSLMEWTLPPYGENTRKLIDEVAYAPLTQQLKFALPRLAKNLFARRLDHAVELQLRTWPGQTAWPMVSVMADQCSASGRTPPADGRAGGAGNPRCVPRESSGTRGQRTEQ